MEELFEMGLGLLQCSVEPVVCKWLSSALMTRLSNSPTLKVDVLYQSDNYLVVNKEFDLVINSDDPDEKVTLQMQLQAQYPHLVIENLRHDFYFVHRLDYATSGILCLALNKKACSAASIAFQQRKTKKYYLALLRGHVKELLMDIKEPIGEDSSECSGNHRMCTSSDPNCILPRDSHTRLLVLELGEYKHFPVTKVLLRPITGRRHQLRVHCASIGHTIVGDYTYSNRVDVDPYRTFLHAYRLVLPNKVENLDIQTSDPFTKESGTLDWDVQETINLLDDSVYLKLDFETER